MELTVKELKERLEDLDSIKIDEKLVKIEVDNEEKMKNSEIGDLLQEFDETKDIFAKNKILERLKGTIEKEKQKLSNELGEKLKAFQEEIRKKLNNVLIQKRRLNNMIPDYRKMIQNIENNTEKTEEEENEKRVYENKIKDIENKIENLTKEIEELGAEYDRFESFSESEKIEYIIKREEKEVNNKEPKDKNQENNHKEYEEKVIYTGQIGNGYKSFEEQFYEQTGKRYGENNEYVIRWEGTNFKIVHREEKVRENENPKSEQGKEPQPVDVYGGGQGTPLKEEKNQPKQEQGKEPQPVDVYGGRQGTPVNEEKEPQPKQEQNPVSGTNLPVVDSGLQVLNDIFQGKYNDDDVSMPEIKARHTLSDNPVWQAAPGGVAVAGLLGLGGLPVAIGGGIAALAIKPLLKRVTGQKKVTSQIEEVLSKIEWEEPERFELLEDYLTEEKIIELTPNHVFLDAMQNVLTRRRNRIVSENNTKLSEIEELITDPKTGPNLKKQLEEERDGLIAEIAEARRRIKDVRRGKEHTSHSDRDNVNGGFFALRNPTTEQYKDALDELAKKEKAMLIANKLDDQEVKSKAKREYERTLIENSKTKTAKRKVFNALQGEVGIDSRDISDREDNRVRNATYMTVGMTAALKTVLHMLELQEAQHMAADAVGKDLDNIRQQIEGIKSDLDNAGNSMSQNDIQNVLKGEAIQQANSAEVAAMRNNGAQIGGDQYRVDDTTLNTNFANDINNIQTTSQTINQFGGKDKLFGVVKELLNYKQKGLTTEQALAKASDAGLLSTYTTDHSAQAQAFAGDLNAEYGNAEINLLKSLLDAADKATQINVPQGSKIGKIFANFTGPIVSACLPIVRAIKDRMNGKEKKPEKTNIKYRRDEEQEQEDDERS